MTLGKSMEDQEVFVGAYVAVKNALSLLDKSLLYTIDIQGIGHYFVTTQVALHEFSDKRLHDPIAEGQIEVPIRELMRRHGVDGVKFTTIIQEYRVRAILDSPEPPSHRKITEITKFHTAIFEILYQGVWLRKNTILLGCFNPLVRWM